MVPLTTASPGSVPRRARYLIPTGLPRRGEVLAVCALAVLLAHLLFAQLTFVLAVAFATVSRVSRWRLWWLLAPAAAGLAWILAIGPGRALAGFTAGPSGILWHLTSGGTGGGGHLAGKTGHPLAGFGDVQSWLPRQFPVALVCAAAEAALAGWLDWLHTDEWAVPPPRPGLLAAARRALSSRALRAGAVVTRDGCALGLVPSTGAIAELRWAELAAGTLIVGAGRQDVTLTGLQVVHAALRRRKPVIVLDSGDAAIARAIAAACRATGVPLAGVAGTARQPAAGASQLWRRGASRQLTAPPTQLPPGQTARPAVDLGRVVRERLAFLCPAGSAELAARACGDLASLAADLRRIDVDGDALLWVPHGELVPAEALAELLREAPDAGVSVLIGTTSPAAATELAGLTGTTLVYRVTDRDLAASLAARAGTWLLPPSVAARLSGQRPRADPGPGPDPGPATPAQDLVASPVIPAPALLKLGQAEFVLATGFAIGRAPQRLIASGRLVPARLPAQPRYPPGRWPR